MREHDRAQATPTGSDSAARVAANDSGALGVASANGTALALLDRGTLIRFQRSAGNAAVAHIVQRKTGCEGPGACDCSACAGKVQPARAADEESNGDAVQRSAASGSVVMRQQSKEVPSHYRVRHNLSRQMFTTDPIEVRKTLEGFVDERDSSRALDLFDNDAEFVGPVPIVSFPGQACDLDPETCGTYLREVIRVVHAQVAELRRRMNEFKDDFQRRANDTLHLLLNDSEEKIEAEKKRYGLEKKEGTLSFLFGADYEMNDSKVITDAAKAMLEKFEALKTATDALKKCEGIGGTLPPGGTEGICTAEDKASAEAKVKEREGEYHATRKAKESTVPILITFELDPAKETTHGLLATLASDAGGETQAKLLYEQVETKLKNIKTTREYANDHKDVVWTLPAVLGVARKLPDIAHYEKLPAQGLQNIAIDDAKSHAVVVDLILGAAVAAVAIGLGMVAAPLGAAGMAGLATAATATEAGIGVALMLKAIHEYEFESAAANSDLDKAKSISQEEPSLIWLAVDIVATIGQVKAAADEFRAFVKLSRAATAAKVAKNETEAAKVLEDLTKKGNDLKPGVGDRLRKEAEGLGTSVAQDAGEIAGHLENVRPSTLGGYTHEIAVGEGRFWRRTAEGRWCMFASPPRCPLGVSDFLLAPWMSGLAPETSAALMTYPRVMKNAMKDPRVGVLLEKYGVNGVKALEHCPSYGFDGLDVLQMFERLDGKVKGAEQLLKDLAAGSSTTRGAIGEINYCEMLLKQGFEVERVGDWINGKKAADIILKDGTVIDMKFYDWTSWRWKVPAEIEKSAVKMLEQVNLRKTQYPGAAIEYVFAGAKGDMPATLVKKLEGAGVTVKGTY